MDSRLTTSREMGDLRQNPTMLRRHYRSEDSHQGPFKASGRNLARSDLKCRVRDGTGHLLWDRRAADSARLLHATSVSDPHRTLTATFRPAGPTVAAL